MMVYGPGLPKTEINLDKSIFHTLELLDVAWTRFNFAEKEMIDEAIYEIKMLELRLRRLLRERNVVVTDG